MTAPRNTRKTVSRDPTVVLVKNTSSISPSSLEVAMLIAAWHTPVPPNEKCPGWLVDRDCHGRPSVFSSMIANAKQHQGGFLEATNHFPCQPQKATSLQKDWFHDVAWFWARPFAVVVYFICVFCCVWPQRTGRVCLMQDTSRPLASVSQHYLEPDSLRLDRKRQVVCGELYALSTSCQLRP